LQQKDREDDKEPAGPAKEAGMALSGGNRTDAGTPGGA
jgi:hypothetical protein